MYVFCYKKWNFFDKYINIWEKVSNITKKNNSELIYNKKYLKFGKKFTKKESFQCFYIPVKLIDSVYRKDENCYPKVFLGKCIYNFFWRSVSNVGYWLWKFLLKLRKTLKKYIYIRAF